MPEGHLNNYHGVEAAGDRVLHGGSWHNPAYRCELGFRLSHNPDFQWSNIGFRVVRNYSK